ncbi:MAG: UDP-glucose 4-epimerase, partial [uncultured Thermoleophilia bacterium]
DRRCGLHRLAPGGRPARRGPRGGRDRRPDERRRPSPPHRGEVRAGRHHRSRGARPRRRRGASRRRLPPRRPVQRDRLRDRPAARLCRQRGRDAERPRGGRPSRRAGRVHVDRRCAVRQRGADPDPGGPDPRAGLALRRVQVGRGGLHPDLGRGGRSAARRLPARQRLRPAPEPPRGGRRRGDLHVQARVGPGTAALRARQADPRLRPRLGRRRGAAAGLRAGGRLQRGHGRRDARQPHLRAPARGVRAAGRAGAGTAARRGARALLPRPVTGPRRARLDGADPARGRRPVDVQGARVGVRHRGRRRV